MVQVTREFVHHCLPVRKRDGHKGTFGKVHILAGSVGLTGAAALTAAAAVRTGSGLVSLSVPPEIWPVLAVKCQEAMPAPVARFEILLENMNQWQRGSHWTGLGQKPKDGCAHLSFGGAASDPLVLDADGINCGGRTYRCSGHQAWPSDGPDPSRWGISPAEAGEGHWP